MKNFVLAGAIAGASAIAMPAAASTVAAGETFCESVGPATYTAASVGGCDVTVGDLSNFAPGQDIDLEADATLFGYVADKAGTDNTLFPDYAQITLGSKSKITFSLFNTDAAFDGLLTFGAFSQLVDASATSATFVLAEGTHSFVIDATASPAVNQLIQNGSDYRIDVAPVPLPAGVLLLLSGLGGLSIMRRKKTA